MVTRGINSSGDWLFGHSLLDYKTDTEELKQNIITSLKSWVGDCFFDLEAGVDWCNYLGSYGQEENLKNNILRVVKNVDGVVAVEKYDAYLTDKRQLIIDLSVSTIYGTININHQNV